MSTSSDILQPRHLSLPSLGFLPHFHGYGCLEVVVSFSFSLVDHGFFFHFILWMGKPGKEFDTGRPSVFTASCASSPRQHAKVNLLLYACLKSPMWNDILLHTPLYLDDRNSMTSTEGREDGTETRGCKADVTEAWKRRRKRSCKLQGRHCRPTQAGTAAAPGTAGWETPALPADALRHCRPPYTGTAAKPATRRPRRHCCP